MYCIKTVLNIRTCMRTYLWRKKECGGQSQTYRKWYTEILKGHLFVFQNYFFYVIQNVTE